MNWKEFKNKVESAGVTDDMELDCIDVSAGMGETDAFVFSVTIVKCGVSIY